MALSWMSVCGLVGSVAVGSMTACGDEKPADPMVIAGQGGTPSIGPVDNPGSGGRSAAGSGGAGTVGAAGAVAAGTGGAGGGGRAGTAGSTAGAGGSTAGAGGSTAAGSGGADGGVDADAAVADAGSAEDDPFGGLFGPLPTSCDGLLCLEDADCATLYPDETATCKLTRCVDFVCE
jgi:hypothetical protein